MGFWIFMLIMTLLCPITMIILGHRYMNNPPESINPKSGYRTSRSMKNLETWSFAQQHFGRLWFILGIITGVLSIIPMALVYGKGTSVIGTCGGLVVLAQMIPLGVVPFILTERALSKKFDEFGVSCDQLRIPKTDSFVKALDLFTEDYMAEGRPDQGVQKRDSL